MDAKNVKTFWTISCGHPPDKVCFSGTLQLIINYFLKTENKGQWKQMRGKERAMWAEQREIYYR